MSVKKENCKDCYEATCKRHATEPADTDKSERLKAAFKRLNTAHDKVKMTNGYVGFNEYCQARKEVLDILGEKPKKEELRCGVDNLVINGYSVHYGGIPFCFLHDPMRHGKLQPLNLSRGGHLHVMTGADPVCIRCKKPEQELGRDWPVEEPKVDLSKLIPVGWYSVHTKGKVIPFAPKESDPELALTVPQMKELFDNLVMEGFTKGEAARIVGIVARG